MSPQAVLPGFRAQRDGQVIHIASVGARTADLSGAVCPGLIDTDFVRFAMPARAQVSEVVMVPARP